MPILLETSVQAQYVIPMAISLSFGILFATVITLFLVPSLYMLQVDGFERTRGIMNWLFDRENKIRSAGAAPKAAKGPTELVDL